MASEVAELVDVEGNGSGEELEIVDVEDPFSQRKQELKDLRARVLILHQNVKRSDKQQKKAIQEEIAQLKALLETKRKLLEADQKQVSAAALAMERSREEEQASLLRAKKQRARAAKAQKEEELRKESYLIAAQMPQLERIERDALLPILAVARLSIHPIDPDGNCMFNAIAHQLRSRYQRHTSQKELRMVAADHIALHREKYADFLEESVEEYCSKLRGTDLWGGHLELDAISSSLQIPIKVYQADAEAIIFGTETSKTPLFICFQKFAYSLGEHYDALIDTTD